MADGYDYEEARKRRVQENLKRFEDLGIGAISKSLLEVVNSEHKLLGNHTSSKQKKQFETSELRRSSRARNEVLSYNDDSVDSLDLRSYRKRYGRRSYTEVRAASHEEHKRAVTRAEKIQCFPSRFCQTYLPSHEVKMVLEDENGSEYEAIYIGRRTGLSGGWRGFAIDHKLDDGDVLVFQLCQPSKFKVYIVKAIDQSSRDKDDKPSGAERGTTEQPVTQKPQTRTGSSKRVKRPPKRSDLL